MLFLSGLRRKRLREQPPPPEWVGILEQNVPLWSLLSDDDQIELLRHMLVFMDEKSFEGQGGMVIGDEVRVTVAGQACLLLLHRDTDYFPGLSSIIVYPGEYKAKRQDMDEFGIVTEGIERRTGESWDGGSLVLSWEDVLSSGVDDYGAFNVVIHEFAHLLDREDGITTDQPLLARRSLHRIWLRSMEEEFERLQRAEERGEQGVLDHYGVESPAEFFAVAVEAFFEAPLALLEQHPDLYHELSNYFRQNPAEWPGNIQ